MIAQRQGVARRGFLKLGAASAALPLVGWWAGSSSRDAPAESEAGRPKLLILVFDTLSAPHLSLYGYRRHTSPYLERFAERATVYHNHTAAGNFTSPSTASLFTGVYPWEHRVLHLYGSMTEAFIGHDLFSVLRPHYKTIVYTHNEFVEVLFYQLRKSLDRWQPGTALALESRYLSNQLERDRNVGLWAEKVVRGSYGDPHTSLFLAAMLAGVQRRRSDDLDKAWAGNFPLGVPSGSAYSFLLEDALDWIVDEVKTTSEPFVGYFHLFPPHEPYRPRKEFVGMFDDGWAPARKAEHFFSLKASEDELRALRGLYDEYLANVDTAFGRFLDRLESSKLLEDMYLIVTSDHGEMFERGIRHHNTETLYQALLHVPLLVAAPGQSHRKDIFLPTSTLDILPTLTHLAGLPAPEWAQGQILPGLGGKDLLDERAILALEAKRSSKWTRLSMATAAVRMGRYKLLQYLGYPGFENEVELYDLDSDPEERDDLASRRPGLAADLQGVLRNHLRGSVSVPGWD